MRSIPSVLTTTCRRPLVGAIRVVEYCALFDLTSQPDPLQVLFEGACGWPTGDTTRRDHGAASWWKARRRP